MASRFCFDKAFQSFGSTPTGHGRASSRVRKHRGADGFNPSGRYCGAAASLRWPRLKANALGIAPNNNTPTAHGLLNIGGAIICALVILIASKTNCMQYASPGASDENLAQHAENT
jgi:hypothetical protein